MLVGTAGFFMTLYGGVFGTVGGFVLFAGPAIFLSFVGLRVLNREYRDEDSLRLKIILVGMIAPWFAILPIWAIVNAAMLVPAINRTASHTQNFSWGDDPATWRTTLLSLPLAIWAGSLIAFLLLLLLVCTPVWGFTRPDAFLPKNSKVDPSSTSCRWGTRLIGVGVPLAAIGFLMLALSDGVAASETGGVSALTLNLVNQFEAPLLALGLVVVIIGIVMVAISRPTPGAVERVETGPPVPRIRERHR